MWPGNPNEQLDNINDQILVRNRKQRRMGSAAKKRTVKLISKSEF